MDLGIVEEETVTPPHIHTHTETQTHTLKIMSTIWSRSPLYNILWQHSEENENERNMFLIEFRYSFDESYIFLVLTLLTTLQRNIAER